MRVIAGKAKGKALESVPGDKTRPILDRVKTALFDTLHPYLEESYFLDLFGGTGAIGIEALSQGASSGVFIELNKVAVNVIKRNLEATNLSDQAKIFHQDAFTYLKRSKETFDIIFIAPPQYKGLWLEALKEIAERPNLLSSDGLIVVQIDPKEYENFNCTCFQETKQKRYGNTLLVFYGS